MSLRIILRLCIVAVLACEGIYGQSSSALTLKVGSIRSLAQARFSDDDKSIPMHGLLGVEADLNVSSFVSDPISLQLRPVVELGNISLSSWNEYNRTFYPNPSLLFSDTLYNININATIGYLGRSNVAGGILIEETPVLGWRAALGLMNYLQGSYMQIGQVYFAHDDIATFEFVSPSVALFELYTTRYWGSYDVSLSHNDFVHNSLSIGRTISSIGRDAAFSAFALASYGWNEIEILGKSMKTDGVAAKMKLHVAIGDHDAKRSYVLNYSRQFNELYSSYFSAEFTGRFYSKNYLDVFEARLIGDSDSNYNSYHTSNPLLMLGSRYPSYTELGRSIDNPLIFIQRSINGVVGVNIMLKARYELLSSIYLYAIYSRYELLALRNGRLIGEVISRYDASSGNVFWETPYLRKLVYNYYSLGLAFLVSDVSMLSCDVNNYYFTPNAGDYIFEISSPYIQLRATVAY